MEAAKAQIGLRSQRGKKNLHVLIFYTKEDNPANAVISHLPGNTSAEDIIVALQKIDNEVISVVYQKTAKRPAPEGGAIHTSPPLPSYFIKEYRAQEIFKLTIPLNTVMEVEDCRLHSATIVSVLVMSGCTAGSRLAACGVGVDVQE
jgi:hypothetical protein